MLDVTSLQAGYGRAQILFDVSFTVAAGEVVVLLGRNGAGKSTTLKAVAGLIRPTSGEIRYGDVRIDKMASFRIARAGVGYVAQGRRIFTALSVNENLEVGRQAPRPGLSPWTLSRIHALFPNLAEIGERPGGEISGGEQQMLAIARTLLGNPKLVLLDEPSEGLAPVIIGQLASAIAEMRKQGVAVLLSEQNFALAQAVAGRAYVLESGHVRYEGSLAAFAANFAMREDLLGI